MLLIGVVRGNGDKSTGKSTGKRKKEIDGFCEMM